MTAVIDAKRRNAVLRIKNTRRKRDKWETAVKVRGEAKRRRKLWPLNTPPSEILRWIEQQKASAASVTSGGFASDVARYLLTIKGRPSYRDYARHLQLWQRYFGANWPTASITTIDIAGVLGQWRGEQLSRSHIRNRRTALQAMLTVLYPDLKNPASAAKLDPPEKPSARAISYSVIEAALAAMPPRNGAGGHPSLTYLRCSVMAYTGLPQHLLMKVQPRDLSLADAYVDVHGRAKGEGVEARRLPLTPDGVAAFRAFHAANAYGEFDTSALNRGFKQALRRIGVDPTGLHAYDLRHSFLTQLYRTTRDLATVGRFAMHAPGSPLTARYAQGAEEDVDRAAAAAFSEKLALQRRGLIKQAVGGRS